MKNARLWTWWDTVTLVAYEAIMIPNALLVHGRWQYVVFIAGLLVLTVAGFAFVRTGRGARARASRSDGPWTAPFWLSVAAGVAAMVAILVVVRTLGAGHSDGWLIVAVGGINPAPQVSNRWWAARAGAVA